MVDKINFNQILKLWTQLIKNSLDELNITELQETNGGSISKFTPIGFGIWLGYEVITNWSDIKSGVSDAFRDVQNSLN
ncbi:MAG: hypothetical protein JJU13_04960 [Balneolaceae bacterium]|nr:hypothetical protein [Balneolaceae bacterium]